MKKDIYKDMIFMIIECEFTPLQAVKSIVKDYNISFDSARDMYHKWNRLGRPVVITNALMED
jgi:hypothetical protein